MELDNLENKTINKNTWGGARQGGGRPKGSLNKATKEENIIKEAFKSRVLNNIQELLTSQLNIAKGASYLFRIDETGEGSKKKRKHVLVDSVYEIQQVLDECEGNGTFEDNYYYITTKTPDNRALDSLMDRVLDKPRQKIGLDGGADGLAINFAPAFDKIEEADVIDVELLDNTKTDKSSE